MILEAYCLKTKQKEAFVEVAISQTSKGGYIAKGTSKDGHKMSLLMSKTSAEAAVAAGIKKEGW
jgi:hypothetical protein